MTTLSKTIQPKRAKGKAWAEAQAKPLATVCGQQKSLHNDENVHSEHAKKRPYEVLSEIWCVYLLDASVADLLPVAKPGSNPLCI